MLLSRWSLRIGSDSKEYLLCRSYPLPVNVDAAWQRGTAMRVLGHHLDDDGGVGTCSKNALAAMGKAFYANFTFGLQRSSRAAKLRFLRTCLCSIARFRWSRWPFTTGLAKKLDAFQRRFLYRLFPTHRHHDEPIDEFFARRHRLAAREAQRSGKWSLIWCQDLQNWHAHVERRHDLNSWSPHLLHWQGQHWLRIQRLWSSARGESRTNTRVARGPPHRRWQDGLDECRQFQ